ncbi:MAG TPA: hypothetical protein P5141_04675, partial [Candidatus Hydrogenedentes bacterium]|nr:hypothetical protein [Candidatus Hydrogenedentota bacterium]
DLLDALGPPDGAWILAGHSLGGRYVAEMALVRPARAKALVLAAAAVEVPGGARLLPRGVPWYFRVPGVRLSDHMPLVCEFTPPAPGTRRRVDPAAALRLPPRPDGGGEHHVA